MTEARDHVVYSGMDSDAGKAAVDATTIAARKATVVLAAVDVNAEAVVRDMNSAKVGVAVSATVTVNVT